MAQPVPRESPDDGCGSREAVGLSSTLQAARSPVTIVAVAAVILVLLAAAAARLTTLDLLLPAGLGLIVFIGYMLGANGVSETVATLVGGGDADYRRALAWGSVWTLAGAIAALFLASALVSTFSSGFISGGARVAETYAVAVLLGAALWMRLATRIGMPISATHTLAGGMAIVGIAAFGVTHVRWGNIVEKVALPLAISPLLAVALALVLGMALQWLLGRCPDRVLGGAHWVSSASASFARGLNESPKVVGLGTMFPLIVARGTAPPFWLFLLVGLAIAVGSVMEGHKVTRTLAEKVTDMEHSEAFAANAVTAGLVGIASNMGMPVSNAEVSSGSITGVGLREGLRRVNWAIVRDMVVTWLVTLPGAGLLALAAYLILRLLHG